MELLDSLLLLSENRIKYFTNTKNNWYKGSSTYFEKILEEIQEAKNEVNTHQVYLEDELGDILWDYICLIKSLEKEGKISSLDTVMKRTFKKYSQRINLKSGENNGNWENIKSKQKKELDDEVNSSLQFS